MQQFAIRKVEKVKLQIAQCSTVLKILRFFAGPIQRSSSTNSSQQSAKIRYLQVDKIVKNLSNSRGDLGHYAEILE